MQHTRKLAPLLGLAAVALSLAAARPAQAQITITLANPNLSVAPGGIATFIGTLTNASPAGSAPLRITGSQVNANLYKLPSYTSLAYTSFGSLSNYMVNNGVVDLYAPGATYTGPLFDFAVGPTAALGLYLPLGGATFSIQGSTETGGSFYITDAAPVTITVAAPAPAAPKPAQLAVLGLGALGLGALPLKARQRRTAKHAGLSVSAGLCSGS